MGVVLKADGHACSTSAETGRHRLRASSLAVDAPHLNPSVGLPAWSCSWAREAAATSHQAAAGVSAGWLRRSVLLERQLALARPDATVSPSRISPLSSASASRSVSCFWITRRSGRAP